MLQNPIIHFEIGCTNVPETQAFLQKLFDWKFDGPETSPSIDMGSLNGLSGHLSELGKEWGNFVTFYVQVDDLESYTVKAKALGGSVLVEPVTIEGQGHFAWIAPPEGQIIGLWQQL